MKSTHRLTWTQNLSQGENDSHKALVLIRLNKWAGAEHLDQTISSDREVPFLLLLLSYNTSTDTVGINTDNPQIAEKICQTHSFDMLIYR